MNKRASGILMPVSSLPGPYGIGCFSKEARAFVDWLADAGQTLWQILPLGPTSYGDSPYQSFSTFAGNPYFIDLETLVQEGLLRAGDCAAADLGSDPADIDYGKLYRNRWPLLRQAFAAWRAAGGPGEAEYRKFLAKNASWLEDYALFMAIKDRQGGAAWDQWPDPLRLRRADALARARSELREEVAFQQFVQYEFDRQWSRLKEYANSKEIRIIGDIPIYVAFDSADTWARPELFQLDKDGRPTGVAGVPPDGFSATGQLWGNPLYDWKVHRADGYSWWIQRLAACFERYDVVRIDHFRGFDEYFRVPAGAPDARDGQWMPGPGKELFDAVRKALGDRPVIAEDLGYLTDTGVGLEDLISIGTIGLIKAVSTYKPERNIKLATYASRCIENEILMHLRKISNLRSEVSFDEPLNTDWDGNELLLSDILGTESDLVMKPLEEDVDRQLLSDAVGRLESREREIITMRFGLDGRTERTQKEVQPRRAGS